MKIRSLSLNNYKKFSRRSPHYEFNFFDPETNKVNEITLITGNNGEGKTSLLQAIAVLIGSAVRDHFKPSDLDWPGFNYAYIQNGDSPVRIKAELFFEQDEVDATREFCKQLLAIRPTRTYKIPPDQQSVSLYLDQDRKKAFATADSGIDAYFLTNGHQYAKQLEKDQSSHGARFERVGGIYWYDEQRTSASITKYLFADLELKRSTSQTAAIKQLLANWYATHLGLVTGKLSLRDGQFDKFEHLKSLYESIFSGRTLKYTTLNQGGGNGIDVVFNDGKNDYDFTEMSAGERAIFPLLLDFANLKINNSIILIDELELHLHPPLQQLFLNALPHLGRNNQFIITTHSPFIASQFSEKNKIVITHE